MENPILYCNCGVEEYQKYWAEADIYWCFKCNLPCEVTHKLKKSKSKKYKDPTTLVMPVGVLTEESYRRYTPWPQIPFTAAELNGWFFSCIGTGLYLVMPCLGHFGRTNSFYSARKVFGNGPKYLTPKGFKKKCSMAMRHGRPGPSPYLLITEGIADAVYVSPIAHACSILGTSITDEMINDIQFFYRCFSDIQYIILAFDSDAMGRLASLTACTMITLKGSKWPVKILDLPDPDKDPLDYPLDKLENMLQELKD